MSVVQFLQFMEDIAGKNVSKHGLTHRRPRGIGLKVQSSSQPMH